MLCFSIISDLFLGTSVPSASVDPGKLSPVTHVETIKPSESDLADSDTSQASRHVRFARLTGDSSLTSDTRSSVERDSISTRMAEFQEVCYMEQVIISMLKTCHS